MQLLNYNNVTKPVDLVPLDSINHKKPIWKCQNLKGTPEAEAEGEETY